MKLYIAGVNHFDPTCRGQLGEWLKQLSVANNGPPAFVAVEGDKNIFAEVKKQRSKLRKLMQNEWPHSPPDLLDILEHSLGYEADTHAEVFPDAEVLWLDEGRQCNVNTYAEDRLSIYRPYLGEERLPIDSSKALPKLSAAARKAAQHGPPENRDTKFANSIFKRIAEGGGEWAIVIVGATHASTNKGYMCGLLEAYGQPCEVTILQAKMSE